jgi:TPR repeat protein
MVQSCLEKNSGSDTAEKQEDADAFFVLGIRYSTGRDVEHDLVAAHKWFNLAATMGHEEARHSRAELSREMPADRIAEAQRMARAWLANRAASRQNGAAAADAAAAARPIYVRRRAQAIRSAMSFSRVGVEVS